MAGVAWKPQFVVGRAQAFVDLFRTWNESFSLHREAVLVRYEDLKQHPVRELRRLMHFLGYQDITQERLECAIRASSMDKLKESAVVAPHLGKQAFSSDEFFGSREQTEGKEDMKYSKRMVDEFRSMGLFEVRKKLGYPEDEIPAKLSASRASRRHGKGEEL